MMQEKLQVLWNRQVQPSYFHIGLTASAAMRRAEPGQFIMLRLSDQPLPLLRRPFSIHRLIGADGHPEGIELLYKVVGTGTARLARVAAGEWLDIVGPLGRGFDIPNRAGCIYIAGGGIGVAPLVFLAEVLKRGEYGAPEVRVFLGGRSADDLLCQEEFRRLGIPVQLTTDDGSAGDQCLVTHPLEVAVAGRRPDVIFACGPPGMLSCVVGIAEKFQVPCQVSVESMMACGIGACLGCALERKGAGDKYLHVCLDGPVFDAALLNI